MNFKGLIASAAVVSALLPSSVMTHGAFTYNPTDVEPPPTPPREFRGAWVATVANIDWPSKPGLPVEHQKAELLAILDRAVKLNLNAIVLQVRPACDAMYASRIEPWSSYLTGTMGKAPEPFYDPLTFAVAEAHRRGLELHAWFNPYRAGVIANKSPVAANHISRTHPGMVHKYGKYLWLEPGDRDVQKYSLDVVMDVVKRYDIDGVHFDDYFYPYKEEDAKGHEMDFPDDAAWKKYHNHGGKLSRDDWRRENINVFVQRVYESIKSAKPWVKFGIAPFGIWQPKHPPSITGFDAYSVLYCDSRKWLVNGWLDYCSPQLYWSVASPGQSYPVLLKWWIEQNPMHRNIWPGLNTGKVSRKPDEKKHPEDKTWEPSEISDQIRIARDKSDGSSGVIHWSMKCLMEDRGGIASDLMKGVYAQPALVPASPWLEKKYPGKPNLKIDADGNVVWGTAGSEKISTWVLQTKSGDQWHTRILPGDERGRALTGTPEFISIRAIDRCGIASPPAVLARTAIVVHEPTVTHNTSTPVTEVVPETKTQKPRNTLKKLRSPRDLEVQ